MAGELAYAISKGAVHQMTGRSPTLSPIARSR